jgi:hypothetical protein
MNLMVVLEAKGWYSRLRNQEGAKRPVLAKIEITYKPIFFRILLMFN